MRVEDAFKAAGISSDGNPVSDGWIVARCQECDRKQRLDGVEVRETGEQTEYLCGGCGAVFVVVGPAPGLGGYRLKDNVVNPLGGMEVEVPPAGP